MLIIQTYVLGPVQTNTYLVGDSELHQAIAIDPAWNGKLLIEASKKLGWQIGSIWLTHAHFDHLGGVGELAALLKPPPSIALHPDDLELWENQGGAGFFGMRIDPGPEPNILLHHGQELFLGLHRFEVRHTPGHTLGHVTFYCANQAVAFCGDVIFKDSIGRTDLPGGDYEVLIRSIRSQILSLPEETRLLSGHGPETTVGEEKRENPYLI